MRNELIYENEIAQDDIKDTMRNHPSTRDYYSFVASKLGCSIEDLSLLNTLPEFAAVDEEGYNIESFFPTCSDIKITKISDNYCLDDFTFGEVYEVLYDGETFIADSSGSPFSVWANGKVI